MTFYFNITYKLHNTRVKCRKDMVMKKITAILFDFYSIVFAKEY